MPINFENFHLLRPELLFLLIPIVIVFLLIKRLANKQSSWNKIISPHLLKFLIVSGEKKRSYFSFWLSGLIACLIVAAVSGPSFRQKNVPVFQTETARVILMDLSLSMDATDIKPARISRARHKIMDFLERTEEGTIGLVVYAGDAFVISPLTSDSNTIASMVPTLSTGIMPVLGSRPDIAINKAIELLGNAKQSAGQIIWLTDGVDKRYIDSVTHSIARSKHLLSILAIGTPQGAPIPLPDNNGFLQDASGNIILPKLEANNLKKIAQSVNGQYVSLTNNSDDIDFIFDQFINNEDNDASQSDERINRWIDDGYWISWIILLLMIVKIFNRNSAQLMSFSGVPGSVILLSLFSLVSAPSANAGVWEDLWKTRDQQAIEAFKKKDFEKAAELFENSEWRASADYKRGNYTAAVQAFAPNNTQSSDANIASDKTSDNNATNTKDNPHNLPSGLEPGNYNYANSLAKTQQLEKAIEEYEKVIRNNPNHEDAIFNKKIVEDLLKQQEQQKEQDKKDQDNQEQQENKDKDSQESDSDEKSDQESDENSDQDSQQEQEQQESENPSEQDSKEEQEKQAELAKDQRDKAEKDQALEHWLEKIPDDPGGLLRRKMYREYQRRGRQQKEEKVW